MENLEPVVAPEVAANPPLARPSLPGYNPLSVAPVPDILGTSPDWQRNFYRPGVSQSRISPLPPQSKISVGATAASQAEVITKIAGTDLQVNGVDNPVQDKLNLTGSGVTYGPGPGQVAIASGGDSVIHGSSFWESDPGYFLMRDDFFPGSGDTGNAGQIPLGISSSVTGWMASGSTSSSNYIMGAPPYLGEAMWVNDNVQNHVMTMWPAPVGSIMSSGQRMTAFFPLLDYPSWTASFVFKFDGFTNGSGTAAFSTSNCTFYVGLTGDFLPASQTRPNTFIGLRFDTDTNAPSIADAFFTLEIVNNLQTSASFVRNNLQGTTVVTNVAPAEGVWHRLDITCTVAGKVTLTLDGSSTNTLTGTIPKTLITDPAGDAAAASFNKGATISWSNAHGNPNFGTGSKINIAGIADVGYTFLNGDWLATFASTNPTIQFLTSASVGNGTLAAHAWTLTGFPALMPFMTGGNDNTGVAPTQGSIAFFLDYFSLLWNPGVAGSGTPDPTKPRYW